MIIEVRTYRIIPGKRDEFIRYFETKAIPAMRSFGIGVIGPFLDLENENKFSWLRTYASIEERTEKRRAFYESALWKNELEPIAMPLVDAYSFEVCETTEFSAAQLAEWVV